MQHINPTRTNSDKNDSSITPPANEQTVTCLVRSTRTTIVSQTASACVMNKPEDQFCLINVLYNTGSQQTFLSDQLVKELKLAPLCQIDM